MENVQGLGVQDVHDDKIILDRPTDTIMDTVEWLNQVRKLDELIKAKEAERVQLWAMATKITPEMSDMPRGSGVSDKVGNIASRLADLMHETNAAQDRYIDQRSEVIRVLEQLPANEYGVLHREYIQYMTQEEIALDMGYSRMQIWRIKQSALKMLHNVIEGYTIHDV